MDSAKLAEALQASAFGSEFPSAVIKMLAAESKRKTCPAGKALFREGDQHDAVYIIHRGHVVLEMCLPASGCTKLISLGEGELLGWSALIGKGRMTANATAVDNVELIEFSGTNLRKRCEADHEFGYFVMRQVAALLAKRLLATRLQMLDVFEAERSSNSQEVQ